jgi:hypothetical protein
MPWFNHWIRCITAGELRVIGLDELTNHNLWLIPAYTVQPECEENGIPLIACNSYHIPSFTLGLKDQITAARPCKYFVSVSFTFLTF